MPFHDAGTGRPVVFLHGWTMQGSIFDNQFARLKSRFRCIAPDLPGHGDNADGEPTIEGGVRVLHAVLEGLDLSGAILVGWSLGAAIAWRHIADHGSGRIAGMISVDMSPKLVNSPGWSLGLKDKDMSGCLATTARLRDHWTASVPAIAAGMFATGQGAVDYPLKSAVEQIASNDRSAMISMWQSLLMADAREMIAELPVPLLAIYGRASRVYNAETAYWLEQTAPQGQSLEFKNAGHSPHLEEPDAFAEAINGFAETVGTLT
ncbi:MAG: alpha/beta hydrolase [Alphaproteobacteria bacterium]|nr:alpha/beta hydrolase [Alphaproteobacteria bacterium]